MEAASISHFVRLTLDRTTVVMFGRMLVSLGICQSKLGVLYIV